MSPARVEPESLQYGGRFALHLNELRHEAGLTVEEFTDRVAKFNTSNRKSPSVKAIYDWESARGFPHIDLYPAIAEALEVKIHDLLPEN